MIRKLAHTLAVIVLLAALLGAGRSAPVGLPTPQEAVNPDTLFNFRSGFWLNLHHFLYEQAVFAAGDSTRRMPRNARPVSLDPLSGYERSVWKSAVAFYRDSVIERSLLFNRRLGGIDRELGALQKGEGVRGQLGWRALETMLEDAAPLYTTYWWPRHDAANRAHIAALEPLLARYGEAIAADLTAAMVVEWPHEPIDVYIVEYANWAGAYTRGSPTRIVISSTEGLGGELGNLETVFHESAHGMMGRTRGPVSEAIGRAFTRAEKETPRSLWHPVLFYTVAEIILRHLAEDRIDDYVPYADRFGLWTGDWGKARDLLVLYWPAYLDGRTTLDEALENIAGEW